MKQSGRRGIVMAGAAILAATFILVSAGCVCSHCQAGSQRPPTATPLDAGGVMPEVTLQTAAGEAFDLAAAVREQPAVLIFYRGGWCPYCTRHLMALQEVEPQVLEAGYRILAISPDRPEKLRETLTNQGIGYTLLSDSDMTAAKAFGLAFEVDAETRALYEEYEINLVEASGRTHYLLPVPAVYVIDRAGEIQFAFAEEDYRVRLEPEALLKVLAATGGEK